MTVRRLTPWLLTALVLGAFTGLQYRYDAAVAPHKKERKKAIAMSKEPLVPPAAALRALSLGQAPLVADLLWLQLIQYFGQGNPYGRYEALGPMLDRITQLDPKFEYPYEFGMTVLPFMNQTDMALTLGERAIAAYPDDGLLTCYHATNYHLYIKDYRKASALYEKAADQPGAPGAARQLAAVTRSKIDESLIDRQAAIYFWQIVAEKSKSDDDRERALGWAEHMTMVLQLEQAAIDFHAREGRYPTDLQELKTKGYIATVPVSPIKRELLLNPETGKVSFENLVPEE